MGEPMLTKCPACGHDYWSDEQVEHEQICIERPNGPQAYSVGDRVFCPDHGPAFVVSCFGKHASIQHEDKTRHPIRVADLTPMDADEGVQYRGQLRFAERFTQKYGWKFLHVHGLGWHRFDGARWAECLDGAEARAVLALIREARTKVGMMSTDNGKMMLQDIGKVESAAGLAGVLTLAENMHPCALAAASLDSSAYLLNTASGTVDLEAGTVSKQDPADHISKVTRAAFDPAASSEEFDLFLKRIQPDEEMRDFLARSLGSALLGVVRDHKLHIWVGTGANGKGTLRDAVLHALGDYAVEVPADLLLVTKYGGSLAPDRMRLKGTRAAFCSEIGNGAKLDEAK